ncbi:hypothetical protein PTI98_008386 [Pleurotus ostreatus]|nr:hypothetical protein PTI98_008386 [Pleurotus ostreatus]
MSGLSFSQSRSHDQSTNCVCSTYVARMVGFRAPEFRLPFPPCSPSGEAQDIQVSHLRSVSSISILHGVVVRLGELGVASYWALGTLRQGYRARPVVRKAKPGIDDNSAVAMGSTDTFILPE